MWVSDADHAGANVIEGEEAVAGQRDGRPEGEGGGEREGEGGRGRGGDVRWGGRDGEKEDGRANRQRQCRWQWQCSQLNGSRPKLRGSTRVFLDDVHPLRFLALKNALEFVRCYDT